MRTGSPNAYNPSTFLCKHTELGSWETYQYHFCNSYLLDHYLLEYSSDLITILLKDSLSSIKVLHVVCTAECSNYLGCGLYTLVPLPIINSFNNKNNLGKPTNMCTIMYHSFCDLSPSQPLVLLLPCLCIPSLTQT